MPFDFWSLGQAIGAGITYSLTTYFKKQTKSGKLPKFEWSKFGTTLVVGALVGLVTAFFDFNVPGGYEFLVALGVVPIVQNLLQKAYRWFVK